MSIARITSIHVLLSLASIHDLLVHKIDVKATLLKGDLEEKIYIDQLESFVISSQKISSKLNKSLYGLK